MKGSEKIVNRNQSQQEGGPQEAEHMDPSPSLPPPGLGTGPQAPRDGGRGREQRPLGFQWESQSYSLKLPGGLASWQGSHPPPVRQLKFKLEPSAEPEKAAHPFTSQPKRWALAPVVVPTHLPICPPS